MNPKDKAKELKAKFFRATPQPFKESEVKGLKFESWDSDWTNKLAKQSALICIDEILTEIEKYTYGHPILVGHKKEYWNEVKKEIEKL